MMKAVLKKTTPILYILVILYSVSLNANAKSVNNQLASQQSEDGVAYSAVTAELIGFVDPDFTYTQEFISFYNEDWDTEEYGEKLYGDEIEFGTESYWNALAVVEDDWGTIPELLLITVDSSVRYVKVKNEYASWNTCIEDFVGNDIAASATPEEDEGYFIIDLTSPSVTGAQIGELISSWENNENIAVIYCDEDKRIPTENVNGEWIVLGNSEEDQASNIIIVQKTASSSAVNTTILKGEIAKVWDEENDDYKNDFYKENDRYNGKDPLIPGKDSGFWAILIADNGPLETAKALVAPGANPTEAEVTAATTALSAAIEKLIPRENINATELYELTHEDLVWSGSRIVDASTTNDGVPLSADSTSSASLQEYQEAKAAALEELNKLFDEETRKPTDYNNSSGAAADNVDDAVTRLKTAKAGLDRLANDNKLADAQIAYNSLGNLANRVFTPTQSQVVSAYTPDSWANWLVVRETALTFLNEHSYPQAGIGVNEAEEYITQAKTLWDACYQDLTGAAAGTAYIHVTDPDHFLHPDAELTTYAGCYEVAVPAEGVKLADALNTALQSGWTFGSRRECFGVGVFLNGIYLYNLKNNHNGGLPASLGYDNVKLKAGDVVTLTLITFPANDAHGCLPYVEIHSRFRSAGLFDAEGKEIHELEVVSGVDFKLTAQYLLASLMDYTGLHYPLEGAKVLVSASSASREAALKSPAIRDLEIATGADGSFVLSLPSAVGSDEGWYLLNLLPTDENAGFVASPYLLIHVSDHPDDLRDFKDKLKAKLTAAQNAYEDSFYTQDQLDEIAALCERAVPAIEEADYSGDADAAFHAAYDRILEIQRQNNSGDTLNLRVVRKLLEYMPTAEDLAAGKLYRTDKDILDLLFGENGWYTRMTAHQRELLSAPESELLAALLAAYENSEQGSGLPALPVFKVKFEVWDADSGEVLSSIPFTYDASTYNVLCQDYDYYVDGESGALSYNGGESIPRTVTYDEETSTFTLPTEPYDMVRLRLGVKAEDMGEYADAGMGQIAEIDEHYLFNWSEGKLQYEFHTLRQDMTVVYYVKRADALSDAKDAAIAELNALYQAKRRTEYTAENWELLNQKYNEGLSNIRGADTTEVIDTALAAAKLAINGVERIAAGEYGSVTVTVENKTWKVENGAPWYGVLEGVENVSIPLDADSTMMSCIETALRRYGYEVVGANSGYISSINEMAQFDGGTGAGWMGCLNDWFVNEGFNSFSVENGSLHNGDVIIVMYTCALGEDIRAGVEGNTDTTLYELGLTGGTMSPSFDPGVTEYTFILNSGASSTVISFTNNNRAFQSRAYLNNYAPNANNWIRSGDTVTVSGGDVIYVGVGESEWPAMGTGMPTKYKITVISRDDAGAVVKLINAIGSVTYSNYKNKQAAVEMAKTAYEALTDAAKESVSNYATLKAAEDAVEGFQAVDDLKAAIAKLPNLVEDTQEDRAAVETARTLYGTVAKSQELLDLLTLLESRKYHKADNTLTLIDELAKITDKLSAGIDFTHTEVENKKEGVITALEDWFAENTSLPKKGIYVDPVNIDFTEASRDENGNYRAEVTLTCGDGAAAEVRTVTVEGKIIYVVSSEAGITGIEINGFRATPSTEIENGWEATMPYGIDLKSITANSFDVERKDEKANVEVTSTATDGSKWIVIVTSEDETKTIEYPVKLTVSNVKVTVLDSWVYGVSDDTQPMKLDASAVVGLLKAVNPDKLMLDKGTTEAFLWLEVRQKSESVFTVTPVYAPVGEQGKADPEDFFNGSVTLTLPVPGTEYAKVLFGETYLDATGSESGITFTMEKAGDYTLIPNASIATVTFHLNGGTGDMTDGEKIVYTLVDIGKELPGAGLSGAKFEGWYDAETGGTKYTAVSADLPEELYARWSYNVLIDEWGDIEGDVTVTATVSGGTATITVAAKEPCVVIVQRGESYERLETDGENPDGSYSFEKEGFKADMVFWIAVLGDFDEDGDLDKADFTAANKAILNNEDVEPLQLLVMGANGKKLKTVDLAKLYLALASGTVKW